MKHGRIQAVAGLACAAAALWVYRRSLGAFFTTDDLMMLEQARGLIAPAEGLWRWLSGRGYFGAASGGMVAVRRRARARTASRKSSQSR